MICYTKLKNEVDIIIEKGWIPSVIKGSGAVGRTFENALGIVENEFEVPDYNGTIEIKTKTIREDGQYKYINLFSAAPDSYLFEIKRVVKTYGYPSKKDNNILVFNIGVYANKNICTRRHYFKIKIDREKQQIIFCVYDIYSGKLIDNNVSWSFDLIKEKLYRKLKYMLYVKAYRKYEHGQVFFKYVTKKFYILKSFDSFLYAIERGYIRITFKINAYTKGVKYGQLKDHGTSFDINEEYLEQVFDLLV